jgi:hypothetical protein
MRISQWMNSKDLSRGTMNASTPFQTDLLLDSLRSRSPGLWSSNKIALAQSMRGLPYLAINTLATQFSSAKPVLFEEVDDELDSDGRIRLSRSDPMYRLLKKPNPLETWADVAYQMSMQLDTTGMAIIWFPTESSVTGRDDGFEAQEMYVIPTGTAYPLPRSPQYPEGAYRVVPYYNTSFFMVAPNYNSGAGAVIPAEQVVVVRNHHPLIRWEGYAVLTAISQSVDTINAVDQSRFSTMMQGCEQTVALELDAQTTNPDTSDLRRIREEWQKVYAGSKNAGKLVITPPGGKLSKFSTEPDKMAWESGWSQLADLILACYQTPKAITGMSGDLTYATLYASLRSFYLMSLIPRLQKFSGGLTQLWIQPTYGDEYFLELEAKKIDDEQLEQTKVANAQKSGSLTHQELRRLNGWADLDPEKYPWVLDRAYASSASTPSVPPEGSPSNSTQDPAVESSRPVNVAGEGSGGPRDTEAGKSLGQTLFERGNLLADAFERKKTDGTIFSLNGKH